MEEDKNILPNCTSPQAALDEKLESLQQQMQALTEANLKLEDQLSEMIRSGDVNPDLTKQLSNKDYTIDTLKQLNRELTVENDVLERIIEQVVETLARRD